jgi:predicted  nucleic acid-binding Zn-ribbon protein
MEERLQDAEQQKHSLKRQIENYMNEEHTQNGQNAQMQRALREETERHQNEVTSLQKQIVQLTSDVKEHRNLTNELETEVNALNEDLRAAKRVEDSLNDEIQGLREKVYSGGRDSEHLRKIASENAEFKVQIAGLQDKLDVMSTQRDRLVRDLTGLQNQTIAETQEFGSIRAERDDLRKSTMAAQINVAKLKAQVNDMAHGESKSLEQKLAIVTRERDTLQAQVRTLRSQLDETRKQVDVQSSRLRSLESDLSSAHANLEREQLHAKNLLAINTSPTSDRTRRFTSQIENLENLLQASRLRQAELGKVNAEQLGEISTLNRRIERLEGELEAIQDAHVTSAQNTVTGRDDRAVYRQLTLAKGQLAEVRAQLSQQEREFELRLEESVAEHVSKNISLEEQATELKDEIDRFKKRQLENVQNRMKLEETIRSLNRQIKRLESDVQDKNLPSTADDATLLKRLESVKAELVLVREDAEQKENKSTKQIRRLQLELDNLRDHTESLARDLQRSKSAADRQSTQAATLKRQLAESRDMFKRLKNKMLDEHHVPSSLTTQVERKHVAELRGLGKQIRYLKAKLFREESFRSDLQYAKKFFLMQIGCFESW